jgi:myo-inositol-1-phosphate synthase
MGNTEQRIGLWMVGAGGAVGSAAALGVAALSKDRIEKTGLVTALPVFADLDLPGAGRIVVGGHEVRATTLLESVQSLHSESAVIPPEVIASCTPELKRMQRDVAPGIMLRGEKLVRAGAGVQSRSLPTAAAAVKRISNDLRTFRRNHRLAHVVVINVSSTEPPASSQAAPPEYAKLARFMQRSGADALPVSSLYALGAFEADCSYLNFTPSTGMRLPAIEQFARQRDVLFMGRDGKTGETLLKSALAPMFATRHLIVRSWVGHNVLGNRDGLALSDPEVKRSKLDTKQIILEPILGYRPDTRTSIEYVPSLADWKTAWDLVDFEGFLGAKMRLQFTWTGSDSLLAAPLVIDLARLTAFEYSRGNRGRMDHLACFFKDPDGAAEHRYYQQWQHLLEHAHRPATTRA